jgi:N-acetylglucosamine kinase-like BadF-type ATPase
MSNYILGVDGGQTATRLLVATTEGEVLWYSRVRSAFSGPPDQLAASVEVGLGEILRGSLDNSPWRETLFECAVLGMSGAEPGSSLISSFQNAAQSALRARQILVVHDARTNLMSASAGQPGIVVIAGGGAVAFGLTGDGRSWSCSGWGYVIGDEGSGYFIGRAAINSFFRAIDRRGPETSLSQSILASFRLNSAVELKYAIFQGRLSFSDIAALVPLVSQAAKEGDDCARSILGGAGRELGHAAVTVGHVLGLDAEPHEVYPTGGVFQETEFLGRAFLETVASGMPQARVCQPAFEPVVGTVFVALQRLSISTSPDIIQQLKDSWNKVRPDAEVV